MSETRAGETDLMIWFVAWDNGFEYEMEDGSTAEGCDWLCTVRRRADGSHYAEYRFRYYHPTDGDTWGGADEKSWYTFEGGTIDKLREACRLVFSVCQLRDRSSFTVSDEIPVHNGDTLAALRPKPWASIRPLVES